MNFLIIIMLCLGLALLSKSELEPVLEGKIKKKIIIDNKYDKSLRPSNQTEIILELALKQLIDVNERTQIITTSFYLFISWNDSRLEWDCSDYEEIKRIPIPANSIWLPDLFVVNSVDPTDRLSQNIYKKIAWLNNKGIINLAVALNAIKTRCDMNPTNFPFDTQNCTIRIGSWQYDMTRISLSYSNMVSLSDNSDSYIPNPIWEIVNNGTTSIDGGSRLSNDITISENDEFSNDDQLFLFAIKRRPLYYMINNIYPSLILNIISLLAFFLPFASQVTLSMSIFLTLAIYSLRVSGDMPIQSKSLPWIAIYYFLGIFYAFVALVWFLIANQLRSQNTLPKFLVNLAKKMSKQPTKSKINPIEDAGNEKKCIKCEMCEKCLETKEKEDAKKNEKNNAEKLISFLNLIFFFLLLSVTSISNIYIWIKASSS